MCAGRREEITRGEHVEVHEMLYGKESYSAVSDDADGQLNQNQDHCSRAALVGQ